MVQGKLFELMIALFELESHIWEAANILRGSPFDRTDWKRYILPLLFSSGFVMCGTKNMGRCLRSTVMIFWLSIAFRFQKGIIGEMCAKVRSPLRRYQCLLC